MPKLIEAAGEAGFSTLLKALEAGALTEFLGGDGPFTLLAPTDEAFAALAPDLLNRLLADEERLNNLLRYHVLQGRYTASDLTGLDTANASMLDEGTAVVEGMLLARRASKAKSARFVVDADTFPQTLALLRNRAEAVGIELVVLDLAGLNA